MQVSEYLRNKLIEHINVDPRATKKRHNNIGRGGRHQNFRKLFLNLKKNNNNGNEDSNESIKYDKDMKSSQWDSNDEKFCEEEEIVEDI
ncbi:14594_t:CDS:2 [Funneliformis mosseae]|uniref:14594_t:CDS:1 n=1 Tax=Funneliformis mosseae TaxID=27381 RepID=A0A9N9BSV2_FUNMO|nr:14594_t:CDS:2 [Funneliformis mosseae]